MQRIMTRTTCHITYMLVPAGLLGLVCSVQGLASAGEAMGHRSRLTFEVAGNANRFVFQGSTIPDTDGLPTYGASFVIEGVIYAPGILHPECTPNPETGVFYGLQPDGTPEFPEHVIGT